MKITNLDIKAYGLFEDYKLSDLAEGLVVIYGANETGKTTLFSSLATVLYGFYPPSSNFIYLPWYTNKNPELQSTMLLKDGTVVEVMRRLTSSAQGTLKHSSHTSQIANRNLPFVQHVSMDLYKALYALMQSNVRSLNESEQHEIEERLLGGMGANLLRSTRECVSELIDKASTLWRPSNRGRPRHKELQQHLRGIKTSHRQAMEKDKATREQYVKLARVQEEIDQIRQRKSQFVAQVRRADLLLPLKKKIQQINSWNQQVKNLSAVDVLPDNIKVEYNRFCDIVKERQKTILKLQRDVGILREKKERFTDENCVLLAKAHRLENWIRRFSAHQQERRNLDNLQRKETRLKDMIIETGRTFLSEPWKDDFIQKVKSIILPELKTRIHDYIEKSDEVRQKTNACENIAVIKLAGQLPRWAVIGTCVVGPLALMIGLLYLTSWIITIGIIITLFGAAAVFYNSNLRRQRALLKQQQKEQQSSLEKSLRRAESDAGKANHLVTEVLRELPITSAILEKPDISLYQTVEKFRSEVAEYQQVLAERQEREQDWDGQQRSIKELTEELDETETTSEALRRLEQKLESAKERRHDFQDAEKRIEQINEAIKGEQETLSETEKKRNGLVVQIKQVVGNEPSLEKALHQATELQVTAKKIHDAERQLEQEYPDLLKLQEEIRQLESTGEKAWLLDPVELELHRDEIEIIGKQLEGLIVEEAELRKDIENAHDSISVGELEGEIDRMGEEMQEVRVRRDRLVLLSAILQEADRIFREKHQPDVLKRASEYLSKITNNRYSMLSRSLEDEKQEHLSVKTKDEEYIPVRHPLSFGVLDQIYFSFRLAVIDHLDENNEPLPLFLDETLINWDNDRFDKGIEILQDVSQNRQVFLFTCHDWIVERIRDLPNVSVHTLPEIE